MSTTDPFLPEHGDDELREEAPLQRGAEESEDGNRPDVFVPTGAEDTDAEDAADDTAAADEPPVTEHTVFRTPTGERADPADD